MKNKKGQVRIIEAAIAILMVLGFIIFIQGSAPKADISGSVYMIEHQVLVEMEKNESIRDSVMKDEVSGAVDYAKSRLGRYNLNFEMSVCPVDGSCTCKSCPEGKSIYGDNVIISSSLVNYSPRKLALFAWS